MDFDEVIDRRGTHSSKWDSMEELYGVSPDSGLSMWVADMDFRAPEIIQEKLRGINSHGIYGYYGCLLYTSPSPRDPKTSRMPSSA